MLSIAGVRLHDLSQALTLEWIEPNGVGGYAASTVVGINTRREHGLLVGGAPEAPFVTVSRLEDALSLSGRAYNLSSSQFPDVIHPDGHRNLREFRLDPFPTFVYGDETLTLRKTVVVPRGTSLTVILYELVQADEPAGLEVRPLLACRPVRSLSARNGRVSTDVSRNGSGAVTVQPYPDGPRLSMALAGGEFAERPDWYFRHVYAADEEAGAEEDLLSYGAFRATLPPGGKLALVLTTDGPPPVDPLALVRAERQRRNNTTVVSRPRSGLRQTRTLAGAAGGFLVHREPDSVAVVDGFFRCATPSRDALVGLTGTTLVTGRFDAARRLLQKVGAAVCDGVLPARLGGTATEAASLDASLWYFTAVRAYLHYTGDRQWVLDEARPVLRGILEAYREGTGHGIRQDDSGLLQGGNDSEALTWMSAEDAGLPLTPRSGKPVEANALWYNAWRIAEEIAALAGDPGARAMAGSAAERTRDSFSAAFWNETDGCLYDCIGDDGRVDASVRPNQIFAASLPHGLLDAERAARMLSLVQRDLLTPYGLRSLSPRDPRYVGRRPAGPAARARAAHMGAAWPWLLGPFCSAAVALHGGTPQTLRRVAAWLAPLQRHLGDAALGYIAESFDGDPPHAAAGLVASSTAVAEILRVAVEHLGRYTAPGPDGEGGARDA